MRNPAPPPKHAAQTLHSPDRLRGTCKPYVLCLELPTHQIQSHLLSFSSTVSLLDIYPADSDERAQNKGLASCGTSGLKEVWINLLGLIRWRTVSQRMTSLCYNAALCAGLYSSKPLKLIVWVTHNPGGLSQIFVILVSLMRKQTVRECDWWKLLQTFGFTAEF